VRNQGGEESERAGRRHAVDFGQNSRVSPHVQDYTHTYNSQPCGRQGEGGPIGQPAYRPAKAVLPFRWLYLFLEVR
jgi:hypothetical protein